MGYRKISRLLAAGAVLMCAAMPAHGVQTASPAAEIAPDPAVRRGVMANSLRYAIMRSATPANGVSLRLAFDVGSYEESEEERGAAHFVEHMAFRSTRQFPDGVMDNRFAALGVSVGRDQNATTSLASTVYQIDLPSNRLADVDQILTWMRSAADGILFGDAAVNVERGVVLAEKDARSSAMSQVAEEVQQFQGPHLRSTNRLPIGTRASLAAMTPARLRAFYERWYRPEHATLVIVGDVSADAMEDAAKRAFASWTAKGPRPVRAPSAVAWSERGLEALTRSGPALVSALSACRLATPDPEPAGEVARIRADVLSQLWSAILTQRLGRTAVKADSGLLGAQAIVNKDLRDAKGSCLIAVPTDENWKTALVTGQGELRRFAADGPTALEVRTAIENVRAVLRAAVSQSATRTSAAIATGLADAAIRGRTFMSPAQTMRVFDVAVGGIGPDEVKAAFGRDWSGIGPFLVATAPTAPTKDALIAAWRANETGIGLASYADRKTLAWAYTDFGKPGRVARREVVTNPDFVRLHFQNGAILNFKRTDFEADRTAVRVQFGSGQEEFGSTGMMLASIAAGIFPSGGLGRMEYEDIELALANTTWAFNLNILSRAYQLEASPLPEQVARQMQLFAAYMTDPAFRPTMDAKLPTAMDMMSRMLRTDPKMAAVVAMENALYPGRPAIPSDATMAAYRMSDFERVLKPALTRSPVEVTIVGDIDEKTATAAVAASFGALPTRTRPATAHDASRFRSFPLTLPPPVTSRHEGPADKAAALVVWPLYVASRERRSEEYALDLLAAIFKAKLRQKTRGELGKAYDPAVETDMIDGADQGIFAATVEATPADLDALVGAARDTAASLARGEFTQADIDQAREPMVAERTRLLRRNDPWAGVLSHTSAERHAADELLLYKPMMEALTLADVKKVAATWLERAPFVSRALPRASVQR